MINNLKSLIILSILCFFINNIVIANEEFNFNISEINILEDGNKIVGSKRGTVTTDDGILIKADSFVYDKLENTLLAKGNVKVIDEIKDYKISSEEINYNKKEEIIYTKGNTKSDIYSRYSINSKDIIFLKNEGILNSNYKTTIVDNEYQTLYKLKKFNFALNDELLKGQDILITLNYNQPTNDKLYFENAIFNLKDKSFIAKNVEVNLKKDIFNNLDNDPRLKGVSATSKNRITKIKKGIFTSCKNIDGCPPWVITAKEITHDKNKRQLIYDQAILKVYNIPILYFPKFFHPDPTVERQSGLLKPRLNNSSILGSSFSLPYYHVISDNKDFTFRPTIFDSDIKMFQNEYRQENKNSSLIIDFGFTDGYKSSSSNKKNSINHLFANFEADLSWEKFTNSKLLVSIKKISNDTYLKVFDGNIFKSDITPTDFNTLGSEAKLILNNDDYSFTTGFESFENLTLAKSDRYQFILPYYNFDKQISNNFDGTINFSSNGSNELNNTNNLKTIINNNIDYNSYELISNKGFKNSYNLYFKNLNTVAKNDSKYKSSPQMELMSILEINSSLPLIKRSNKSINYLTPKASLRFNPGDMKDYSSSDRSINVDNIYDINRLGIDDSFEEGKSLTFGLEYKKTNLSDINKYFEAKIATVYRDKKELSIPTTSGINNKNSNIFGKISNNYINNVELSYDFILDNDLNTLMYNSLNATLNYKNFKTTFNFLEENGHVGDTNSIENKSTLNFDNQNYLSFNTRRNRKIDLTEYYDFIYEYKNDCLVAGIKYNKTYYEDRDLKPSENILFSITLSPLTSFEQKIDQ